MIGEAGETRALIVEDDPNIVDLIRSNLAVRGFDTVVSTDGARALRLLETEAPDIVLLAVSLSLALGLIAGFLAAQRLVHLPPLELLSGRRV